MLKYFFVLLFIFSRQILSYKIVVFSPDVSSSQFIWNQRVSETLSKAGHDVTMIIMKYYDKTIKKPHLDKSIKTYTIYGNMDYNFNAFEEKLGSSMFEDISIFNNKASGIMTKFFDNFVISCEKFLNNKEFLNFMVNEKFDIAFTHMFEHCPIGIIHYAKIPTWVWLSSGILTDHMADDLGAPSPSSYVPPLRGDYSDRMDFMQRVYSFIGHSITSFIYHKFFVTDKETALFRKYISPDFPDLRDLSKKCPLAMINSNELYDTPRPTLHKIISIGGLGMTQKNVKPLEGIFKEATENDKIKGIIIFTFGSMANASYMPYSWKESLMNAFKQFPDYEVFIRYDTKDIEDIRPKNVHLVKWLPQIDLLQHPKAKMIFTHGGYNSLQESIFAGVPMICIPLSGDQHKNSRLAENHGFGVYLKKSQITENNLVKTIKTIIEDENYSKRIKRMQSMVMKRPIQSDELLIKWTQFLGEFKNLDNMIPYGTQLGFIQYYQIDVVTFLIVLTLIILLIISYIVKKLYLIFINIVFHFYGNKTKED
uniref:glucuronosyltransferase n=1 Tax=Parastrongyloides trichosuri TaxID=131310 RepID=A0A0N5A677_PARTI